MPPTCPEISKSIKARCRKSINSPSVPLWGTENHRLRTKLQIGNLLKFKTKFGPHQDCLAFRTTGDSIKGELLIDGGLAGIYYVEDGEQAKTNSPFELKGTPSTFVQLAPVEVDEIQIIGLCTDSDGGKNPGVKGITKGPKWATKELVTKEDKCITKGEKAGLLSEKAVGFPAQ